MKDSAISAERCGMMTIRRSLGCLEPPKISSGHHPAQLVFAKDTTRSSSAGGELQHRSSARRARQDSFQESQSVARGAQNECSIGHNHIKYSRAQGKPIPLRNSRNPSRCKLTARQVFSRLR